MNEICMCVYIQEFRKGIKAQTNRYGIKKCWDELQAETKLFSIVGRKSTKITTRQERIYV